MCLSLEELQAKFNKKFYNSSKNIYSSFITFAGSRKLQFSRAKQFFSTIQRFALSEVRIAEVGAGPGKHTILFLDELKKLGFDGKVHIDAYDFSETCLRLFEKSVSKNVNSINHILCDVGKGRNFFRDHYELITFHEMLDDVPARVFILKDCSLYEVLYTEDLLPVISNESLHSNSLDESSIPQHLAGYHVVFNLLGCKALEHACNSLSYHGYCEVTDYGFTYDTITVPAELWNINVVREINSHITVDLNFSHIAHTLKHRGVSCELLPQKAFCEKYVGEKLYFYDSSQKLDYYTVSELLARKRMSKMYNKGIIEADNYWYLKLWKEK